MLANCVIMESLTELPDKKLLKIRLLFSNPKIDHNIHHLS